MCFGFPVATHPNCCGKKINHDLTEQKDLESLKHQYDLATALVGNSNGPKVFSDYVKLRYNDPIESRSIPIVVRIIRMPLL